MSFLGWHQDRRRTEGAPTVMDHDVRVDPDHELVRWRPVPPLDVLSAHVEDLVTHQTEPALHGLPPTRFRAVTASFKSTAT
jgi:hypothetical protein